MENGSTELREALRDGLIELMKNKELKSVLVEIIQEEILVLEAAGTLPRTLRVCTPALHS